MLPFLLPIGLAAALHCRGLNIWEASPPLLQSAAACCSSSTSEQWVTGLHRRPAEALAYFVWNISTAGLKCETRDHLQSIKQAAMNLPEHPTVKGLQASPESDCSSGPVGHSGRRASSDFTGLHFTTPNACSNVFKFGTKEKKTKQNISHCQQQHWKCLRGLHPCHFLRNLCRTEWEGKNWEEPVGHTWLTQLMKSDIITSLATVMPTHYTFSEKVVQFQLLAT